MSCLTLISSSLNELLRARADDSSPTATLKAAGEPFIKKMRFQVPESARLGSTVRLSCAYELSGASLHAMKLFKDDKEVCISCAPLSL